MHALSFRCAVCLMTLLRRAGRVSQAINVRCTVQSLFENRRDTRPHLYSRCRRGGVDPSSQWVALQPCCQSRIHKLSRPLVCTPSNRLTTHPHPSLHYPPGRCLSCATKSPLYLIETTPGPTCGAKSRFDGRNNAQERAHC